MSRSFASFREFYPCYLAEHQNAVCRRLHFVGTTLVLVIAIFVLVTGSVGALLAVPVAGYGFAWLGHFLFEKNRPATFRHPWYSLLGDFVMYRDMLIGRVSF